MSFNVSSLLARSFLPLVVLMTGSASVLPLANAETSSRFSFTAAKRAFKLSPPPPAEVLPGKWTAVAYAVEGEADGVYSPTGRMVDAYGTVFSQHVDFKPMEDALGSQGFEVAEYSLLWETKKLSWNPPKAMGYLNNREISWRYERCRWVQAKSMLLCGGTPAASFVAYQKLPSHN